MTDNYYMIPKSIVHNFIKFQFAHKFIISNLMVLYNCSVENGFDRYFMRLDPVYFLQPFCDSPIFGIRIHTKFIAGRLVQHIPSINRDILKLDDEDIKVLCEMIGQTSTSPKFEVHHLDCLFTATELLSGIRSILHYVSNRKGLLSNSILTSLVGILIGGGILEKKAACLVIWDLIADSSFLETLNLLELPLADILRELQSCFDPEFDLLLSGLDSSLPSDGKFCTPVLQCEYKVTDPWCCMYVVE